MGCAQRELESKHSAFALRAAKRYPATMLFDQTLGDPQSQTSSHVALGCEERVENVRFHPIRDATSVICKHYLSVLSAALDN